MRAPVEPSLNFLILALIFTGTGAALWHGWLDGRLAVLALVASGWIVSLCLHEFGHALAAYLGGDHAVADTGYLTLDPLKYTDPVLSLVLPILYLFLGGFGLPGGAVYIRTGLLRSAAWASVVSAAGPFATFCSCSRRCWPSHQRAPMATSPTFAQASPCSPSSRRPRSS